MYIRGGQLRETYEGLDGSCALQEPYSRLTWNGLDASQEENATHLKTLSDIIRIVHELNAVTLIVSFLCTARPLALVGSKARVGRRYTITKQHKLIEKLCSMKMLAKYALNIVGIVRDTSKQRRAALWVSAPP